MGNSLRCCLACMIPCGALDLIRIVHLNGHVEEITRPVTAGEILKANPNHVLSKPCAQGVDVCRIVVLSPESELKKGGIYFLVPDPAEKPKSGEKSRRRMKDPAEKIRPNDVVTDRFFADVVEVSESKSKSKSKRRNRRSKELSSSWTPYLDSICEDL